MIHRTLTYQLEWVRPLLAVQMPAWFWPVLRISAHYHTQVFNVKSTCSTIKKILARTHDILPHTRAHTITHTYIHTYVHA